MHTKMASLGASNVRAARPFRIRLTTLAAFFLALVHASASENMDLQEPNPGDQLLHILSPTVLELFRVNTKQPDPAPVDSWDWVNGQGTFVTPNMSSVRVLVNGQNNPVAGVGFKRRPLYAPLVTWDLRIGNYLYLQVSNAIPDGASVRVINDGTLWPTNVPFTATADPMRYSPAIHVNQAGYLPGYPKKAIVGQYLGDMGEMTIPSTSFSLVDAQTGATAYQGTMSLRRDMGYNYQPTPYQQVWEADFTSFDPPGGSGTYRVVVPGIGAALPFRIGAGSGMAFARTYALGMYHQRSGTDVALPYTRFTHATDHTGPVAVPTNTSAPFVFTWNTIANYATQVNSDNPPQVAPPLTNPAAQLYPFVNQGPLLVAGGHFEAGDYNRVTHNEAQVVHVLVFAADSLPGVGALDNLGLPESGDGVSDLLQEAKWGADSLAKLQDTDGGFYYSVYPQNREYENNVLPENGDPQVVWPKNTATTAAAVAALAQCASSPQFKRAYPQTASNYFAKAQLGWQFLTNAIARFGTNGTYQRIQQFGDDFTDRDDLAWAACEMYLATGDPQYQQQLFNWFPDPTDYTTFKYGWERMFACYGNVARDYAFAASSGRLSAGQLDPTYLARCITVITNCGDDHLSWSQQDAYGISFPPISKAYRSGGWFFSAVQAFDLVVAWQFNPRPEYLDAILRNLNYEGGCNPVNVSYVTGLGWKWERNIVDQYSVNSRRVLPKDGMPVSNLTGEFYNTWTYGAQLKELPYPADYTDTGPYAYYDRWCDDWNVSTESSTTDIARSLATAAWLAARTSLATQPWHSTNASIAAPTSARLPGQPVTVHLSVADPNLSEARIIWEALGQQPSFGNEAYTFTLGTNEGAYWIEAEVQWPDGRHAFATNSVTASNNAAPLLANPQWLGSGGFGFQLRGAPQANYTIQASTNLTGWVAIATTTLPPSGVAVITDPQAGSFVRRFYRAVGGP
ncbi:MAG: glycoside hydrolase family 9 [Verrucomicrobia bacterium]|nr:MAG: glycoside hydrolase family 9 [Verrucomicrobiota bacterium]